jgi:hypothetical protein
VLQGEVVVESDSITCVAADCPDPPGASVFNITDAFIFPGFIDAHNHVAYNVLPKWTPLKLYSNRGQWQAATSYGAFKAPYATLKDQKKLFCQMVKWGEIVRAHERHHHSSRNRRRTSAAAAHQTTSWCSRSVRSAQSLLSSLSGAPRRCKPGLRSAPGIRVRDAHRAVVIRAEHHGTVWKDCRTEQTSPAVDSSLATERPNR